MPSRVLSRVFAFSLAALLVSCANEGPPPTPQSAYVPPPVPEAPAAPWCARPAEKAAFDVAELKSNMMVTAKLCNADDKYNAFIMRYRPTLVQNEKVMDGYFSRNAKLHWQQQRDDYITKLANAQSQRANVLGDQFCQRTIGEFDEAMALPGPDGLASFAGSKTQAIPQVMKFSECPAVPEKAARATGTRK
jgi:hypothetical protein